LNPWACEAQGSIGKRNPRQNRAGVSDVSPLVVAGAHGALTAKYPTPARHVLPLVQRLPPAQRLGGTHARGDVARRALAAVCRPSGRRSAQVHARGTAAALRGRSAIADDPDYAAGGVKAHPRGNYVLVKEPALILRPHAAPNGRASGKFTTLIEARVHIFDL
jgi:hypothetical protein